MKKKLALLFCAVLFLLAGSSTQICNVQGQVGSGWMKHAGNPVLGVGAAGFYDDAGVMFPSVIKDGDTYKMWYTGYDGSTRRIGYATSSDGISWTRQGLVLDLGPGIAWDSVSVSAPWVIKDGSTYMMWYVGSDGVRERIGLATSSNGIAWNKKGAVLAPGSPGQPDDAGVNHPTVIKEGGLGPDGSSYVMWYGADDGTYTTICMAYSGDGKTWSKYDEDLDGFTEPVLNTGAPGSWDARWASEPSVLKSGGVYFMWYTGWDGLAGAGHHRVGLAYSTTDGKHWVKTGPPVLPVGGGAAWDYYTVRGVSVIQDRLDFKMWYTGTSGGGYEDRLIGYATNFMRVAGAMGLVDAPANTVYYIYPDYQGSKPAGTGYAALSDWTALGMVIGMSGNQQYITTDTDTSVVSPSSGGLVLDAKYSAVLCGGWGVSGPTKYYEVTVGATPAYAVVVGSTLYFYSRATGASITGTAMDMSLVSTNQDMFIIQAFQRGERSIIILYGYGWKGSYAAALWFKYGTGTGKPAFGSEGIPMRDDAYYIFRWTDADGDLFVDLKEISFVASGD